MHRFIYNGNLLIYMYFVFVIELLIHLRINTQIHNNYTLILWFGLLFVANNKYYRCVYDTGEEIYDILTHEPEPTQNKAQSNIVEIDDSGEDDNNNSHQTNVA